MNVVIVAILYVQGLTWVICKFASSTYSEFKENRFLSTKKGKQKSKFTFKTVQWGTSSNLWRGVEKE